MKAYLKKLMYENGEPSLTRHIAVGFCILFTVVSLVCLYLATLNISWGEYGIFAPLAVGAGAGVQVANKGINSKFNSEPGSYRQKEEIK